MDDLESALQSLEVKMEGESSSAAEMLVRHTGCAHFLQIVCRKLCKMFVLIVIRASLIRHILTIIN